MLLHPLKYTNAGDRGETFQAYIVTVSPLNEISCPLNEPPRAASLMAYRPSVLRGKLHVLSE